jgi:hypothetical protein
MARREVRVGETGRQGAAISIIVLKYSPLSQKSISLK